MEFGQLHESKASRDDPGQSDQPADGTSAVRSYGCVFCKRGFTTAQALGGHMNIHRKDRAKARPDSSIPSLPSNPDKKYVPLCSYFPFSNHPPHYYQNHEPPPQSGPSSYSPLSERGVRPSNGLNYGGSLRVSRMPRLCNLSEEDWRWGLSLQVGPSDEDGNKVKGQAEADANEDRLDLELRLGHEH